MRYKPVKNVIDESVKDVIVDENLAVLKSLVQGAYDMQSIRISYGNRICQQFRHRFGLKPNEDESKMEAEQMKFLKAVREEYKLLADGLIESKNVAKVNQLLSGNKCISTFAELQMINMYEDALAAEHAAFKNLAVLVHEFPLWTKFLSYIHGIGETTAAIILTKLNIHKAKYASCIWKYCGLDVVVKDNQDQYDNRARGRFEGHLVEKEYIDKEGNTVKTRGISYCPWLKMKMLSIVGPCLIKQNQHYKKIYDNYKHRISNDPRKQGVFTRFEDGIWRVFPDGSRNQEYIRPEILKMFKTNSKKKEFKEYPPARLHAMSLRYMVKMFLIDLYEGWKQIEGLEKYNPYHVDKLNLATHTVVLPQPDGTYAVCDATTGAPVKHARDKKITDLLQEEYNDTPRNTKTRGQRTSAKVSAKAKRKLAEANSLTSAA